MKKMVHVMLSVALAMLVSCVGPSDITGQSSPTAAATHVMEGVVTGISSHHGNVYTNIRPDQYQSLGLVAGKRIKVTFGKQTLVLPIGQQYTDVPIGSPLAVLHREGLTFAIRDGNFSQTYPIAVGTAFNVAIAPQK